MKILRYSDGKEATDNMYWDDFQSYHSKYKIYVSERLTVRSDDLQLSFNLKAGYDFCCGTREISNIQCPVGREKGFIALMQEVANHRLISIGAFIYVYVEDNDDEDIYDVKRLLDVYPGASHGEPFINPNGGNRLTVYTLPCNQESIRQDYPDEEEDNDDEEF